MTLIGETQKWLESQGFPLEMRTAAAFRGAGFYVQQAGFYVDRDTQKMREIDVEAIIPNLDGLVRVQFIVECKATTKPWVLLCSEDTILDQARHKVFAVTTKLARESLFKRRTGGFERLKQTIPWLFKENDLVGYAFRQAHSEKDSGYEAAITVAKACTARIGDTEEEPKQIAFGFPVIVTNAPLIKCWLADDGQLHLEEVKQGEFLFLERGFGFCIRVVTASHLPAFAVEAKNLADELQREFKPEAEQFQREWDERFGSI